MPRSNVVDFDDLLSLMVALLRDGEVAAHFQRRYRWLLVDEFQDTNAAQYELVRLLGMPQVWVPDLHLGTASSDDVSACPARRHQLAETSRPCAPACGRKSTQHGGASTWRRHLEMQQGLMGPHCDEQGHVFVVGDPDQAIYRWRGADSAKMSHSFLADFPGL